MLKNVLDENRTNLLIGSSCVNGEIFEIAKNKSQKELEVAMLFYDYIEVQPLDVYNHLLEMKELTEASLIRIIKTIIATAIKLNKIVIASGDVHYLDPEDKIYREVYINTKGIGGVRHPLFDRKGRVKQYPSQHFRTTKEMLAAFEFLDDEKLIKAIVIDNSQEIAAQIDFLKPIKDQLYTPKIEDVDKKLRDLSYKNAQRIYGENLPIVVSERLERELDAIIKHNFAVIY